MAAIPQFRPSHRGSTPSIAEQLQTRARTVEAKGQKVIYLQVGQPSSGAPAGTLEAVEKAGRDSTLGYTSAAGNLALRERLTRQYAELYGANVDPGRIVITFGASGAMILAIVGCFDVGQRVGLPQPFSMATDTRLERLASSACRSRHRWRIIFSRPSSSSSAGTLPG